MKRTQSRHRFFVALLAVLMLASCASKMNSKNDKTEGTQNQSSSDITDSGNATEEVTEIELGSEITFTGKLSAIDGTYNITADGEGFRIVSGSDNGSVSLDTVEADISCIIYENHTDDAVTMTGVLEQVEGKYVLTECDPDCDCCITYKIVEPTEEEIGEICNRIGWVLAFDPSFLADGDFYDKMFDVYLNYYFFLHYPNYYNELAQYIDSGESIEDVLGEDPQGYFGEIPEEFFNESGQYIINDDTFKKYIEDHPEYNGLCGYRKHSSAMLDWLIGEFWNQEIRHEVFVNPENPSDVEYYYYDGAYYDKWVGMWGGTGPGPQPYTQSVDEVEPLEDNKYRITFTVDMIGETEQRTATIAMKESSNGFRFWSIYDIQTAE